MTIFQECLELSLAKWYKNGIEFSVLNYGGMGFVGARKTQPQMETKHRPTVIILYF